MGESGKKSDENNESDRENDMKKDNKRIVFNIIFICAVIAFIICSFYTFMQENRQRILVQNDSFIEAATKQSAARIDDLIATSQSNIEMMAHLYGTMMTKPVVDSEILSDMIERSSFDYVEFINTEGQDLTADGRTADLSDREYFLEGMKGHSGKCVVYNSRITNETLLIFYTPFYYENEIIGVLSGIVRGERFDAYLQADYFNVHGSSYLLERNGNVILYRGNGEKPDNLIEGLKNQDKLNAADLAKLEKAVSNGSSTNFNYKGKSDTGSAYITALAEGDWMLVQSFPSSVTKIMSKDADTAGIRLEIKLMILFVIYILYLLLKNQMQKRQLISENQENSQIVDAIPQLFTRFALVDFEKDTYEYLEDKKSGAPVQGAYTDLIAYLLPGYINDSEAEINMGAVITQAYVKEHLTEDVPYLQFEYEVNLEGHRWENMSILCLQRKEGVPVKVLFAIQDVTAIKEREMEIRLALKSASEVAEAANRAKSDFLARMSHDIRTPMNAIMGMTAVAAMHIDDRERLTDCLSKITISSRHLLALINDVLDMSKIESGKVTLSEEPFSMADMVESVVTIVREQVRSKRQELRVHISDIQHEDVIGDTLRLRQVFVNILGNAVKFTPEGGIITFSIQECESRIHDMACYEFICEDNGVGMEEEFIKDIFSPFARSKDSVSRKIEGTGLGMSITRNIVRMMEGDIQVESKVGEGSKFTVQIHLKLQDMEMDNVDEFENLKVLVADDDENACISTCDILDNIGMSSEWVLSGEEAIEKTVAANEAGEDFAVIILDWKMPGMDGVETAKTIRSRIGDHVPIIILSAYDWTDVEAEAREAGIQAFIEKPLFRSRLVYALKSVLSKEEDTKKLDAEELKESSHKGKRILLVEDNEINREIACELLGFIEVEVEQAEDGKMATEMVENNPPGYYDLIFMDIQMPVMNGYEAARYIRGMGREDTAEMPIIAMTANAFADDIKETKAAGMNDHLAKPVEVSKLLEILDKWL